MPEPDALQLLFAAALPTPVAFALAFAVRDGREFLTGSLFLLLAAAIAALVCFFTGSLLAAVPAALAPVALLAHARFLGAHRAPPPRAGEPGYASGARPAAHADAESPLEEAPPDALHLGMAFVGDVLETADRIGELRHKRRLRRLARQRAERELAAPPAAPARVPELQFRARPRREPVRLLPPE